MFKPIKSKFGWQMFVASLIVLLSACTQDFGDSEGRSGGINEKGQSIYADQCASCHGSSGEGGSGGSLVGCSTCGDSSSLIAKIERDMPSASNPLDGDDARDTASYIIAAFNSGSAGTVQRTLPGLVTMSENEAIYKIAFELAGRLPTDDEISKFSEGVSGEKEVIYQYMTEDYFYERLKDVFNESLLTDKYRSENNNDNSNVVYSFYYGLEFRDDSNQRFDVFPDLKAWESSAVTDLSTGYLRFFAENAIARKPLLLVEYLARNDRDFREFVNGKYTVVNKFSFDAFGDNIVIVDPDTTYANGTSKLVENPQWAEFESQAELEKYLATVEYLGKSTTRTMDRNEYIMAEYPYDPRDLKAAQLYYNANSDSVDTNGVPHSGIITDEIFLNVYTATETNMHRHRARMIYWFFAAKDLLAIEGNRDASELVFDDFGGVNVGVDDATQTNDDCKVCHDIMDPVAKAFENYSLNGLFDPFNELDSVPEHDKNIGWGLSNTDLKYNSLSEGTSYSTRELQWLGEQIAKDPAYARGISQIVVSGLLGQSIMGEPGDESPEEYRNAYAEQSRLITHAASEFKTSGYNIKALVYAVVKSAYYRSAYLSNEYYDTQYSQIGSVRYLAPQLLHQKLRALNSGGWNNSLNLEKSGSRQFIGGMNSSDVLKNADSVGGIISAVLERMAVEEACDIVDNEFDLPRNQRSLFKYVETDTDLTTTTAQSRDNQIRSIRSNIQFLYLAMLHIEVSLDSEEVDLVFDLFMNALNKRSNSGIKSGCTRTNGNAVKDAWYIVVVFLLSDYRFIYS